MLIGVKPEILTSTEYPAELNCLLAIATNLRGEMISSCRVVLVV